MKRIMKRIMKWVLLLIAVIIVSVGLVAGIGTLLPEHHVARRTVEFNAPPEVVWKTINDVAAYPTWRKELSHVELLPEHHGHRVWREHGNFGSVTMEQTEAVEPTRMVGRIMDSTLAFGGEWIYQIEPLSGGSRLTVTEEGEVYNPIFRFLSRFLFGHTATIDAYLTALGDHFGEKVTLASPEGD